MVVSPRQFLKTNLHHVAKLDIDTTLYAYPNTVTGASSKNRTRTYSSLSCTQFMTFCQFSRGVLVVRGVWRGTDYTTGVLGFLMAVSFINVFNDFGKETSKVH